MSATRKKNGQFKKGGATSGAKKHRGKKKGGGGSRSLEARVSKLEKNQKVIVAVLHTHEKALHAGGLLTGRSSRKSLPGGR